MSGGGSTTSTTQTYSPEEAARRAQVMDEAARIYGATAPAMSSAGYPGAQPIPFSNETMASQDYLLNYANGPLLEQLSNLNGALKFGLGDVLYPESNPALQATIDAAIRPIQKEYFDPGGLMAQTRGDAVNSGQFGSSRHGIADAVLQDRYLNTIGDKSAQIATEGYLKGLDTFSKSMAFAPQVMQLGTMPGDIYGAVGQQKEMLANDIENYLADQAMWGLNAPWTPLENYAGIVYGGSTPTATTTSDTERGAASRLVGGAAAGLGAYSMLTAGSAPLMAAGPAGWTALAIGTLAAMA